MARNFVAVIIGLTVAGAIVWTIEMANYNMHPLPDGLDVTDKEAMTEYIKTLPAMAYVMVLLAHILGSIGGAWVASIVADSHERKIAIGIGTFLLVMGAITLFTIYHPTWFMIADILVYIPCALLGHAFYNMRKSRNV